MIYGILSTVAFLIILPFWLIAGAFKPKLIAGFKEKCGFYKTIEACAKGHCGELKTIAFYGVSVGEVVAMENLIKKTRENFPQMEIVIFTGTQTGQEIAHKKLGGIADFVTYFPLDFPFCINNMLDKINPDAIFVMETELWPNFANITKSRKIPTYIINARISDRTYKSYKKLSCFFAPILKKYTNIFPQSKQDMEKLISIGANPSTTEIMGNLKFDIKKPDVSELNFERNPEDKIILAGSTHYGENEIVLDVFENLKNDIPNLKLIIAPRHPEYNEKIFNLIKNRGIEVAKRSNFAPHPNPPTSRGEGASPPIIKPSVMLLDTMGELGKFYSICDIAFLGGSFACKGGDNFSGKGVGGHNPLEASIFNKPVISGPSIHNFKDIYAILTSTNAASIVKNNEEFVIKAKKLLTDKEFYNTASKDCVLVFEQNKGALDFVIKVIQSLV